LLVLRGYITNILMNQELFLDTLWVYTIIKKKQDLTDTLKYIKCMENLYDKYPHVTGTSQGLARCFVDLSTK